MKGYRKAKVLFGQFEGQEVDVEGTDKDVWGKSWADMNGNPCALMFAMRSTGEGIGVGEALSKPVYYCKLGGLAHLLAERQLEFVKEAD